MHEFWVDKSRFDESVDLRNLKSSSLLSLENSTLFKDVDLNGAKIGGGLVMNGSTFEGDLDMNSLQVDKSLFMRILTILKSDEIFLGYAKVGGNLDISGSTLPSLNMIGAVISGEFRFNVSPNWNETSTLNLKNTSITALQDHIDGWPNELELEGFSYKQLGGLSNRDSDSMVDREVPWLIKWLEKQKHFSPLPYTQLANVLKQSGHPDKADAILYASHEHERIETVNALDWFWLSIKKVFIGYGYKIHYALGWIMLFVAIGAIVFSRSKEAKKASMPYGIAYSLDMLLPIIKLREKLYKIDLSGWRRYYFYFHMMMGYVLASFLIAGLSGMTG